MANARKQYYIAPPLFYLSISQWHTISKGLHEFIALCYFLTTSSEILSPSSLHMEDVMCLYVYIVSQLLLLFHSFRYGLKLLLAISSSCASSFSRELLAHDFKSWYSSRRVDTTWGGPPSFSRELLGHAFPGCFSSWWDTTWGGR